MTVLLYELSGLALILPARTGVAYRNQTGGHSCLHTELEGYLVPILGERPDALERLSAHFIGSKYGGWCDRGIDAETAEFIDSLLAEMNRVPIVVDRDKLNLSWESWIHVKIQSPLISLVQNAEPDCGILTWPNSD